MTMLPPPPPLTLDRPGLATSALVLGIVAVCFAPLTALGAVVAVVTGILAIVHGAKAKRGLARRGQAVAGFVLGIVGLPLAAITVLGWMSTAGGGG
jgi:Flp pilus assembly protein TadB